MIKISLYKRLLTVYGIIGKTFGSWFSPIITGLLLLILRTVVLIGSIIDYICFSKIRKGKISNPILIVGNPRSGTTFLHHYLTSHKLGTGSQLWQMLYPSVVLQKIIRPFLPFLEKVDLILIMSVNPGFGGQKFMPEVLDKVRELKKIQLDKKLNFDIEIDGGINFENSKIAIQAGANILVSGTTIFKSNNGDIKKNIELLKSK